MELTIMLRYLWRHRVLAALSVLLAVVAALLASFDVGSGGLKSKENLSRFGAATSQFYVDTRRASLVTSQTQSGDLIARARIVASFIGSGRIRSRIAERVGVPTKAIAVEGPLPDTPGQQSVQPVAQQRANDVITQASPFSIYVDTDIASSTITLYVQADTGARAVRIAEAVPQALSAYLGQLITNALPEERRRLKRSLYDGSSAEDRRAATFRRQKLLDQFISGRTVVRVLGEPVGSDVTAESGKAIGLLVFIVVLLGSWAGIILVSGVRARAHEHGERVEEVV